MAAAAAAAERRLVAVKQRVAKGKEEMVGVRAAAREAVGPAHGGKGMNRGYQSAQRGWVGARPLARPSAADRMQTSFRDLPEGREKGEERPAPGLRAAWAATALGQGLVL